jgi:cytochrome c-type biogenesis protein CcsB
MTASSSPLLRFVRFLGKVQFTIVLLLGGAVIMTVGTIVESRESREVAWSAVYGTVWFDVFLFLIGMNLVVAVINRIPIQRQQWPFVLTHFAIVTLLAGAWISASFGYEGSLVVSEGSEESRLLLDTSEIRARWQAGATASAPGQAGGAGVEAAFPLGQSRRLAGRVLQEEGQGRPEIRIAEYIEDGVATVELGEAGPGGSPGVELLLSSHNDQVKRWLIAGDPRYQRKDLGPVEIEFRLSGPEESLAESPAGAATPSAEVLIAPADGDAPLRIPLPGKLAQEVETGPGLVAEVREFFVHARVMDGKLVELPTAPVNPAAIVELRSERGTEIHTVFANFPQFNGIRGRDPQRPLVASVSLTASAVSSKPRVAILLGADDELRVQLTSALGQHQSESIAVGQTTTLESLGLDLRLLRLVESAQPELSVQPSPEGGESGAPYVRVEARLNGKQHSLWVGRGARPQAASFDGSGVLEVSFGPEMRPLPFAIALEEFELIRHPGSRRPSEYRSRVQVKPAAPDLPSRAEVISMNRPLDVAGFRLFQSSYQLGRRGEPDTTILTVSYDPGVPIVYVSFVLIILGIAWGLRGVRPASERAARGHAPDRSDRDRTNPRPPTRKAAARRARRPGQRARLALLLAALAGLAPATALRAEAAAPEFPVEVTRSWAILADGRVKPLLTFANENVLAITGRERFDGLSALEILWGYALASQDFAQRPYLRIDSLELKAALGLPAEERRFSFSALMGNQRLQTLVDQARQREQQDQELSRLENDALAAYGKLGRVASLISGEALTILPLPDQRGAWASIQGLQDAADPALSAIHDGLGRLAAAHAGRDGEAFRREAESLTVALRELNPPVYPPASRIDLELFYEDINAFGNAWKLYLAGFLVVMFLGFSERPWGYAAGMLLIGAGFVFHTIGIGTRWAIAQRAPVSDMYESLVFMGWGAIALGLIPEATQRKRFIALAAGLMGFLCLAFAENLPIDSAINPLVPVLAHTSWLSIHVMTIMISYSALAVAAVLGHVLLFVAVFQRQQRSLLNSLSRILYRTLQLGLLFLAAGIIFGAIWANESWGRYWGWDPKETWSLITLFVYLAIIHARFAGWLGYFGLAASSVLGFLAVVMTYYGVNFILASGLHSYGFSEGGQIYAALYAVVEIAIVAGAYLVYRSATDMERGGPELPGGGHPRSTDQEPVS